ncbi:MAG: helix-turn-helix domain-containing protein [Burkholderiaceae bacterium]
MRSAESPNDGSTSYPLIGVELDQLGLRARPVGKGVRPGYRSWIRPITGPLSEYVSALLAVEFDAGTVVEVISLPHELMTLTQWLGSTGTRFECEDQRGMRSALHGIRTSSTVLSRPGDFLMLRAFLSPLGAVLLARGHALPSMAGGTPLPWAHEVGMHEALDLERVVLRAGLIDQKLDALGGWIERRIFGRGRSVPASLRAAQAAMILSRDPAFDMNRLAQHVSVTRRQLERDFSHWLSISPRRFAQTVRLQRLAQLSQQPLALAQLANEVGFADQAHMTRAVRQLTGMTPRNFLRAADNALSQAYRQAMAGRIGYIVNTSSLTDDNA